MDFHCILITWIEIQSVTKFPSSNYDGQTDRRTDGQTDRQDHPIRPFRSKRTDRQTDGQTDGQTRPSHKTFSV